ncbi:hypothetical protein G9A89_010229 [Geosiphon pyriformis]|nr:hypothetical protein G9A89_010229 [Geosiphon pyriformis]
MEQDSREEHNRFKTLLKTVVKNSKDNTHVRKAQELLDIWETTICSSEVDAFWNNHKILDRQCSIKLTELRSELKAPQINEENINYVLDRSKELNSHANAIGKKRFNIITADQNDSDEAAAKNLNKSLSKEDEESNVMVASTSVALDHKRRLADEQVEEYSNPTYNFVSCHDSSTKRQRDDSGEDREEQTSVEVSEEPEMINGMDCVPYIVDGIDVVTKLLEQKAVDNYEAAFYDILDLSEERESGSIKSRFPSTVWKKLRRAARIEMIKMNDEVEAWLVAFDDEVS